MRKRKLGKTGIEVSELTLGTWGLSGDAYGPLIDADVDRTIDRAVELGITLFDTADVYGGGAMERKLGARLPAQKTMVVTKIGTSTSGYPEKRFDPAYLDVAFERAQARLKRECVDVVLLHNPSFATFDSDEPFAVLKRLKDQVHIKAWGVSVGSVPIAERAIERGAELLEMPYNCMFTSDVKALTQKMADSGVGFLAHSVLAYGLLAGHWTRDREFYPPDHRTDRWNQSELKRRVEQLGALRAVVGGPVPNMRSVALRYVLSNERVSSAVLGPRNVTQLDQLVRDAGRMPPYLARATLAKLEAQLIAHGVTGE